MGMDLREDRRDTKREKDYVNMLGYVADSEYGIPTRCPCGGRIIDEVRGKEDYDTLPGKRFFTCKNYQGDGFHYRQPWVIGVQEEIERMTKRVEEAEQVINGVPKLNNQLETLEAQVKILTVQVDNLHVQVTDMEKMESLSKRLEEAEEVIKWVPDLNEKIKTLEAQVEFLTGQVDNLTAHVETLEKLCFE
uniref:Zinc finger GRF-type domain-containing protein n=1 Tax=Brassica campestris TaxID=3711 RepID=M4DEH9_BRACM